MLLSIPMSTTASYTLSLHDALPISRDDRLAAQWYRRAAEQGNSEAQDALGTKYLVGQGLEQNKEEAVKWFRKSARQGNGSAMYHLGVAYYNGDGVAVRSEERRVGKRRKMRMGGE